MVYKVQKQIWGEFKWVTVGYVFNEGDAMLMASRLETADTIVRVVEVKDEEI